MKNLLVIIDDDAISRLIAQRLLKSVKEVQVPTSPADVDAVTASDVGLLIVDRHMQEDWQLARDRLIARLGDVQVVEWTCGGDYASDEAVPQASQVITKTGSGRELMAFITDWKSKDKGET